jgi:hypothetical protein
MKEINVTIILPRSSTTWPQYRLLEDMEFFGYTVPKGFITDGATVPRAAWALLPPVHEYFPSAVLHDWLIEMDYPRKQADQVFRDSMIELGVNKYRARIMYAAVRAYAIVFRKK